MSSVKSTCWPGATGIGLSVSFMNPPRPWAQETWTPELPGQIHGLASRVEIDACSAIDMLPVRMISLRVFSALTLLNGAPNDR